MKSKELGAMQNIAAASAACNICLCLILIPRLGMIGAALANGIGYVFITVAANYMVRRHLNITIHPF